MPARVIGDISEGALQVFDEKKLPAQHKIKWSQVHDHGDHQVTLNYVEQPSMEKVSQKKITTESLIKDEAEKHSENPSASTSTLPYGGAFMVYATVYDENVTHVTWQHEGEPYEVWSNINWAYLEGFSQFEARGQHFGLFLLVSHASSKESLKDLRKLKKQGASVKPPEIPSLPSLKKDGPRYELMLGNSGSDSPMVFIEGIHDLYEAEQVRLLAAHEARKINAKLRAANPPVAQKPDRTINFWKRDVAKELKDNAEAASQKGGNQ